MRPHLGRSIGDGPTDAASAPPRPRGARSRSRAARLGVALAAALIAWLAFGAGMLSPLWLAVPLAALFAVLVLVVARPRVRGAGAGRTAAPRTTRRAGAPRRPSRSRPRRALPRSRPSLRRGPGLFGVGSLFALLCRARTRGEETLARWLLRPRSPEIRARQARWRSWRASICARLALVGEEVGRACTPRARRLAARPAGAAPRTRARRGLRLRGRHARGLASWRAVPAGGSPRSSCRAVRWRLRRACARRRGRSSARRATSASWRAPRLPRGGAFSSAQLAGYAPGRRRRSRPRWRSRGCACLLDLSDARRNQFFAPARR